MTLRNMRENGVRTLAITCGAVWCNHYAVLDLNAFADDLAGSAVPLARMRGQTGTTVRQPVCLDHAPDLISGHQRGASHNLPSLPLTGPQRKKVATQSAIRASAWRLFNIKSQYDRPRVIKPDLSI